MRRQRHRKHKVRFEHSVKTPDGGGGFTREWQEFCTVRCQIERIESFRFDVERINAGGVESMPTVRIHCFSSTETRQITPAMRAVDTSTGKVMNVNFVQDIEGRGRNLVITATESMPT